MGCDGLCFHPAQHEGRVWGTSLPGVTHSLPGVDGSPPAVCPRLLAAVPPQCTVRYSPRPPALCEHCTVWGNAVVFIAVLQHHLVLLPGEAGHPGAPTEITAAPVGTGHAGWCPLGHAGAVLLRMTQWESGGVGSSVPMLMDQDR